MIRVAHFSDLHHFSLAGINPLELLGKRLAGGLNLVLNRARKHDGQLLERLLERLAEVRPDHVVMTGDFTNLALEGEFAAARAYADRVADLLGGIDRVSVIPGNHDAYTEDAVRERRFERAFAPYLEAVDEPGWPYLKKVGELALIGCTTAVPTPFLCASGRLGAEQLARLEVMLARPDLRDRFRVVLIHHPPVRVKGHELRQLEDRRAFGGMIARVGADLILHGHDHMEVREQLDGPGGTAVPVLGVSSASYKSTHAGRRGRFNVYEIDQRQLLAVRSELA